MYLRHPLGLGDRLGAALRKVLLGSTVIVVEDLLESEVQQVVRDLSSALSILADELHGGLLEEKVDLLKSLVLGLVHEEDLIEPSEHGNATVEAEGKTSRGHCGLHGREVVGNDE